MKLSIALAVVVSCGTTSTAKAHWIKTPGQIHRIQSKTAQIEANKQNLAHAEGVLKFCEHQKCFNRLIVRDHRYMLRYSQNALWKLRWWGGMMPPHYQSWLCIHHYEGSWLDGNDPYWGGLQMDRGFMRSYAPNWLLRKGWANSWTPLQQMWVAENAHASGRGFNPWPNTAHYCNLL